MINKEYIMTLKKLIKKIKKIDPIAAEYLKNEAPKLPSYTLDPSGATLTTLFHWDKSSQGHQYWNNIHFQL